MGRGGKGEEGMGRRDKAWGVMGEEGKGRRDEGWGRGEERIGEIQDSERG